MSLLTINKTLEIAKLDKAQAKDLQHKLNCVGHNLKVDGIVGEKTKKAWETFKLKYNQAYPTLIGKGSIRLLSDLIRKTGFSEPELRIITLCKYLGLPLHTQIAYVLATVKHETNDTFKPVKEAYWLSEEWRLTNLPHGKWYGRGYVQLTHRYNYEAYANKLGIDLVNQPDLALEFENSLYICVHGMANGVFTGRRLDLYINLQKSDFFNARKVVNGTDRAMKIAKYAEGFLKRLDIKAQRG